MAGIGFFLTYLLIALETSTLPVIMSEGKASQSERSLSPALSQVLLPARDVELRHCSGCRNDKFAVHFFGRIEDCHTCDGCCARQSTVGQGAPEEGRISFDEFVESVPSRYRIDSTDAGEVDVQYSFHAYISMDAEMAAMGRFCYH
ncbi:hypothetical protein BX666DRAFT_1878936 [Dichotomocladium elegans]|nr:hypothetical protein BX666DRAFT_1878936 [Dichotomocladium elegans]